ncbi:helix-turn-helix domain-containing protein [Paenibacillus koleovorans]|uniref:helix-turn-helix domain-containing protein n=1 Tax=Paenibacillus koleovorans TaxID=121608 RepID=UPI000FD94ED8|nr:helix-turn-helix domain-containing protein [Paenibacillus koleovorans]
MKNRRLHVHFPNTSSVFFKLLSSFIVLILVPILIFGSLAYFLFTNALQEEVKKNNDILLKHVYVNIEQKMEEVKQTLYQISLTVDVDSGNPLKLLDVTKTLNRIKGTQSFIDDVYVYYKDKNWIITESGLYYPDYFFNYVYKPEMNDQEQLLQKLQDRNVFQDLGTFRLKDGSGKGNRYIVVLLSFPLYNDEIRGTIVVLINENKFVSMINSVNPTDAQTGFYILNDQLQPIIESDTNPFVEQFSERQMQVFFNETLVETPSNRARYNDYFVSQFHSNVTDWKYIAFSSAAHVLKPVFFLRNWMVITSLFLLSLGVMLSIFLAKNLYKPIGEIVRSFQFDKSGADWKKEKKISELELISNHIHYITDRNQQLMQSETEHISLLKDYYAKTMILGIPEERMKVRPVSAAGSKYPYFSVIAVKIEMTDPSSTTFQQMNFNSRIIEVFNQTLNNEDDISCMVTNIGRNQISILANYEKEDYLALKLQAAMKGISELPENFRCTIALGIGRPCEDLMTVNRSYEEALEALNYRELDKTIQLIQHRDINFVQKFVDYPIDLEQKIIGNVLSGDYVKLEQVLNEIIDRNRQAIKTYQLLNDLYNTLMATANKIIQRSSVNNEEVFDEAVISIYMNKEIVSLDSMKDLVFGIYRYMIETLYGKKESKNDELKNQMILYIGSHYHSDISLTTLADHFKLNPKYLSRYFKDQTGVNFVQYVNQVRIEHAKELLLKEKNLHIDEIGEKVGYLNKNTFITTFKKQEGMTPGKFRDISS